jgi:hypothetical protein
MCGLATSQNRISWLKRTLEVRELAWSLVWEAPIQIAQVVVHNTDCPIERIKIPTTEEVSLFTVRIARLVFFYFKAQNILRVANDSVVL